MASEPGSGPLKELATSRARFVSELGERLATLRQGLGRLGPAGEPSPELNAVRRRLHALGAAAEVLHFTAVADALGRAQAELTAATTAPSTGPARERVARILDLLPSLALGAPIDVAQELEAARSSREPLCVLVLGDAALEAALHKPGPLQAAEIHLAHAEEELAALVTRLGPDVLVVDGDEPGLGELLARLPAPEGGAGALPVIAVGGFDSYEGMLRLVRCGVRRVLPKPVDFLALQRSVQRLAPRELPAAPRHNPFLGQPTPSLIDAVAAEAQRAFAVRGSAAPTPELDTQAAQQALAALWSAFARIRALAARASQGLRLPLEGPHGMIPLAPAVAPGPPREAEPVLGEALAGRRFVVAGSDPALLGVLSRALQRLGASVLPTRDGAQALELLERHWPDGLIGDAQLPSLDGFALCRAVRSDIALADLPVALVCWKEDLLEHARRSGEPGARDSHLDPASFLPLAEALGRRAALERRLERHQLVHGRLDGVTPRVLLQLACRRESALLRLHAGHLTFELAVAEGRLVHARLLDAGAPAAEGSEVLGPFLGARSGRFSLQPLATAPAPHFSGDLMTVLASPIARARRARAWLSRPARGQLARVELDPRVAALYLEEAPAGHRIALARLLRGDTPGAIEAGEAGGGPVLAELLLELARRGGVLALFDAGGRDVLAPELPGAAASPGGSEAAEPLALPAAMTLAEAVLQAVSQPGTGALPAAHRRTEPGLAPASPSPAAAEPREAAPAGSAEPRAEEAAAVPASERARVPAATAPAPFRSRLRAAVSPVLVTLAAAAVAFAGMRAVLGGALERWGVSPSSRTVQPATSSVTLAERAQPASSPAEPLVLAGRRALAPPGQTEPSDSAESQPLVDAAASPASVTPAAPEATPGSAGERLVDAGASQITRVETADVELTTELLAPSHEPGLHPGRGLLEVRTWTPQRIYVDEIFVGNYQTRLIPLEPGTHRVRLLDGSREIEHLAPIEPGRRTRVSARPKSSDR